MVVGWWCWVGIVQSRESGPCFFCGRYVIVEEFCFRWQITIIYHGSASLLLLLFDEDEEGEDQQGADTNSWKHQPHQQCGTVLSWTRSMRPKIFTPPTKLRPNVTICEPPVHSPTVQLSLLWLIQCKKWPFSFRFYYYYRCIVLCRRCLLNWTQVEVMTTLLPKTINWDLLLYYDVIYSPWTRLVVLIYCIKRHLCTVTLHFDDK